ncbi:type III pantothenate kinase [candidate division KSB1 bacterium]
MLLAIDIGNTITTNGVFDQDGNLINRFSFSTYSKRTKDELVALYSSLIDFKKLSVSDIKSVYISSVVPEVDYKYRDAIDDLLKTRPVFVNHTNKTDINLKNINPEELGADRLCNCIAAYEKYGGPVLIIDLGTAVTYDLVSDKYEFLGGMISTGIELSSWALIEKTSKLFKTDLTFPEHVISTTTAGNIQSGLFYGKLFEMKGIIDYIKINLFKDLKVILSGGFAREFIEKFKDESIIYDENLTLEGIRCIYNYDCSKV